MDYSAQPDIMGLLFCIYIQSMEVISSIVSSKVCLISYNLHGGSELNETYAAFTLNGLDDQERNLTIVKTDFQVLKLNFYACNFKQAFYPLHKLYIA